MKEILVKAGEVKRARKVARIGAIAFALLTALFTVAGCSRIGSGALAQSEEFLRIHIRANSNSAADQEVKYAVKEEVVEFLTPRLTDAGGKDEAQKIVEESLPKIVEIAENTLIKNGFTYGARAGVKNEKFPTRKYEDVTLSSGFYDALIIELGSGEGDNWWCVAYPPLCFSGQGENYVYKSKLAEIWGKIFG